MKEAAPKARMMLARQSSPVNAMASSKLFSMDID
jgi:hypothetical protein